MTEAGEHRTAGEPQPVKGTARPVLLTVLCLFSMVYFGITSLVFLYALFHSGTITRLLAEYTSQGGIPPALVTLVMAGAALLHVSCLAGALMIWKLRKKGYLLLSVASLLIAVAQLFLPGLAPGGTVLYVVLIFLFGLFYRLYRTGSA